MSQSRQHCTSAKERLALWEVGALYVQLPAANTCPWECCVSRSVWYQLGGERGAVRAPEDDGDVTIVATTHRRLAKLDQGLVLS